MQCGTLNWIMGQKNDISGKTSDTQIKRGVELIVCTNVGFLALTNVQW